MEILFWSFLILVFYTYIGYGILLFFLVKLKELFIKPKVVSKDVELPQVTLFITAYNEEDVVDAKMHNSLSLDYPKEKLQIVWVTDGSDDRTNEILRRFECIEVYYIPDRKGKTPAMNRGMAFIKTPLVIFTDANTMLNKSSIREIVLEFEDEKVGCVSGEKRIEMDEVDSASSSGEGFYWRYESRLKELDSRLYTAVGAAGELFGIRTALFEPVSDNILLDDFIISMRIVQKGYKIAYCPEAYAVEKGSSDMKEEEKRKIRIAAGGLQSIWILRGLLNIFRYHILTFQYISHRVLRWTVTPIALLLLLPVNIFLCLQNPGTILLWVILILQILFYISSYIGYKLSQKKIKHKLFFIPYYFLFMNINVFKGFSYLRNKKGSGGWERAKRK